jgi:YggT family protein
MICATNAPIRLLCLALTVYWVILLARVIVSWIELSGWRPPTTGPIRTIFELMFDVTEPVLKPLRRIVPPAGPLDLSVIVAFVIVFVAQNALKCG